MPAFPETHSPRDVDRLIIGAGVIGLAVGWMLSRRGVAVTILERGEAAKESSWAGAGMLAPASEMNMEEASILHLGQESLTLYPDFVRSLEAEAGSSVNFLRQGALSIALNADEEAALRRRFAQQQRLELPLRWLEGKAAQELEPALSPRVVAGVLDEQEAQVDNRLMGVALRRAFERSGGVLHEHAPADYLEAQENAPPLVWSGGVCWRAKQVLLAAGSWSAELPGLPPPLQLPVRPVKGQMLALQAPQGLLQHNLHTSEVYLVPRMEGRLLVGATVEDVGFDRSLRAGGVLDLLRGAWHAIPEIAELPLAEMWCGFRPGSRDNAPILGRTTTPGLYVATGHFRNGFLLAPITAQTMSALMLEGTWPEAMEAFSVQRFALP